MLQGFFIVSDAQASIAGPPEIYVKKGSTISLTCTVNVHSTPPSSISWQVHFLKSQKKCDKLNTFFRYHGHSIVDFDSPRGGISLETDKTGVGTTSKLQVTKALLSDTGNYTCMPSNASPASAVVHVLNGKILYSFTLLPTKNVCVNCTVYDPRNVKGEKLIFHLRLNFYALLVSRPRNKFSAQVRI